MARSSRCRYIVTAVEQRRAGVEYLQRHIPSLEVAWDTERRPPHSAMTTFLRSLEMASDDDPVMHFEDDVCLTQGFQEKSAAVISGREENVIQFFSRLKDDTQKGARWQTHYSCLCCTYFPAGMSSRIRQFHDSEGWDDYRDIHPSGLDTLVDVFLSENRIKYWLHVPSLVQHATEDSVIGTAGYGRGRSRYRQSPTFSEPELAGYPYSYPRRKMFSYG
jgi:hypothetical protein